MLLQSHVFTRLFVICCFCVYGIPMAAEQSDGTGMERSVLKVSSSMREIGYSVGDVARQIISIETLPGYRFDPASLPSIGKTSGAIELRDASWKFEETKNLTRHTLVLDWQIFQVLQEVRAYPLMPLSLKFRHEDQVMHAELEPASAIVASLLPVRMDARRLQPMPDVDPQPRATTAMLWGLLISVPLTLLTMVYWAWYFDWFSLGQRWHGPYRLACRRMRTIRRSKNEGAQQLQAAMKCLRQACDDTAGAALSRERLHLLFERNPWILPLRPELEQFYADSDRWFFAGDAVAGDIEWMYQLGCRLRALES